jgi:hypothetical protein
MTDPLLTENGPGILGRFIAAVLIIIPAFIIDKLDGYTYAGTWSEAVRFVRVGT